MHSEARLTPFYPHPTAARTLKQCGFVESLNVSVAAALIMYEARQQRMRVRHIFLCIIQIVLYNT